MRLSRRQFQSTPPVKAATNEQGKTYSYTAISIHAAREDTPVDTPAEETISIHAAREGGDGVNYTYNYDPDSISIHAAREGGDNKAWKP